MFRSDDILGLVRQRPFQPFRIHMSDGSAHDIRHPEQAMLTERAVIVGVPSEHKEGIMQDLHRCAILHITRLEELAEAG